MGKGTGRVVALLMSAPYSARPGAVRSYVPHARTPGVAGAMDEKHSYESSAKNWPAGQLPAAQPLAAAAATAAAVVATRESGQISHPTPPPYGVLNHPTGHVVHAVEPSVAENVPALQAAQLAAPRALELVPRAHRVHASAPAELKDPAGHGVHAAVDEYGRAGGLKEPAPHSAHEVMSLGRDIAAPGGHAHVVVPGADTDAPGHARQLPAAPCTGK